MIDFIKAKKQLNSEQLEAVETIEGPVMVLAGPGTGKTQIVALRIAEILEKTQLNPSNILALTFTESGVTALKRRLEKAIGITAYQVRINTFHGFAGEIISTFPHVFKKTRELIQLSEADQFSIIEKILNEHTEWQLLRPLRAPEMFIKDIANRIKDCKKEALTSKFLVQSAEMELKAVADEKNKSVRETRSNQANRLKQFALFYDEYQKRLDDLGRYDYEDTILFVIEALKNNDEVRANFQEKYQYLLVDEYQDTNNAQNKLVELLADFFPNPNLFVVGDDKQAIFRFQGASVANMLHFAKKYPMLKTIELKKNYRSTPEILKSAGLVIEQSHTKISQFVPGLKSELSAVCDSGPKPQLQIHSSLPLQWQALVEQLVDANKKGLPWHEMAVLFRNNKLVDQFRTYAESAGLPIAAVSGHGIINEPIVKTLFQTLRAASDPNDNLAVLVAARLIMGRENLIELFKIQNGLRRNSGSLIELLAINDRTKIVPDKIMSWQKIIGTQSIAQILLAIINDINADGQLTPNNRLEDLELLRVVLEFAKSFTLSNPSGTIEEFLRYMETLKSNNLDINIESIAPAESGIHISSLHKSKGLEFDLVIMASVDDQSYKARASRNVIPLPGSAVGIKNWQDDAEDDERRVFYVGMTRAKKELIFTYSRASLDGRELSPCQFILDCQDTIAQKDEVATIGEISKTLHTSLTMPNIDAIGKQELAYIRELIADKSLSASALHAYQICPRQFLLSYILNLPSVESPAQAYGTAIHQALEEFGRLQKGIKKMPDFPTLVKFYEQAVSRIVMPAEQAAAIAKGAPVLKSFYEKVLSQSPAPEMVEYNFSPHHVALKNINLTGKVDRIEPIDPKLRTVRLIDYKTGTAKTRNDIEGGTKNSDGSIKQQLVFYALLAELDRQFPYSLKECVVQFVDDKETFRREAFVITRDEINELKKTLVDVSAELLSRTEFNHTRAEFDKGCEICAMFPNF